MALKIRKDGFCPSFQILIPIIQPKPFVHSPFISSGPSFFQVKLLYQDMKFPGCLPSG